MKWKKKDNRYINTQADALISFLELVKNNDGSIQDIIVYCNTQHEHYSSLCDKLVEAGFKGRDRGYFGVLNGIPGSTGTQDFKNFIYIVDQFDSLSDIRELSPHFKEEKNRPQPLSPYVKPTLFKPPMPSLANLFDNAVIFHRRSEVTLTYSYRSQAKALQSQLAPNLGIKPIKKGLGREEDEKQYYITLSPMEFRLLQVMIHSENAPTSLEKLVTQLMRK